MGHIGGEKDDFSLAFGEWISGNSKPQKLTLKLGLHFAELGPGD